MGKFFVSISVIMALDWCFLAPGMLTGWVPAAGCEQPALVSGGKPVCGWGGDDAAAFLDFLHPGGASAVM